jgi:hypothetical protein
MANNIYTRIKKNFTKKDASYLIVIGVLSGLFLGSIVGDHPRSRNGFDYRDQRNISFKNDHDGHMRGKGGNFYWHENEMMPQNSPSPSVTPSTSPSTGV